jgi:hypothetical protein
MSSSFSEKVVVSHSFAALLSFGATTVRIAEDIEDKEETQNLYLTKNWQI